MSRPDTFLLLKLLEKTVRTVGMYPSGNPKCREFVSRTHGMFSEMLSKVSPLKFRVKPQELLFRDEVVYRSRESGQSLAFLMYKDGIRELHFRSGLEEREIAEFAQICSRYAAEERPDDDLVTELWEKDLEHIGYLVTEEYLDDYLPDDLKEASDLVGAIKEKMQLTPVTAELLKDRIRTDPGGSLPASTIPLKTTSFRPESLRFADSDLRDLKESLGRNQSSVIFEEMIKIVTSILQRETDPEYMDYVVALLRDLLPALLLSGSLDEASALIRQINYLEEGKQQMPPGFADRVEVLVGSLSSETLMWALTKAFSEQMRYDTEKLSELIGLLPSSVIPSVTALFEHVDSMKARKALCRALARLGSRNLPLLAEQITDSRWFVVRNVAYVLGVIGDRSATPYLGTLIHHPDRRIRKEVLRALGRLGGNLAWNWILKALEDEEEEVRLQALHSLPKGKNPTLARRLTKLIGTPGFANRRFEERTAFCRALGRIGTDAIITGFGTQLAPRKWYPNRRQKEEHLLAVMAMISLNTPEALSRLREISTRTIPEARAMIREFVSRPQRKQ